jgi:hypothetical protein
MLFAEIKYLAAEMNFAYHLKKKKIIGKGEMNN